MTRLEIANSNYPLAVNIPIFINYMLSDVRDPSGRNSSFSKTIQLYGTNDVNILFENIFEVNVDLQTFNPNKKTEAKYFSNGILVFEGSLQLLSITRKPDGLIVYDCCIIGNENGIFLEIGDKLISELDFSAYNHTYSRANIIASGTNTTSGLSYYYPFIDNGTSVSESQFKVENFVPCFFAHEYIKKIIESNGYTYTSTFLTSSFFKSIIVYPNYNQIKLSATRISNSQYYVGLTSEYTLTKDVIYTISYPNETSGDGFYDAGNQVSGTTATIAYSGNYNITMSGKYTFNFSHSVGTVTYCKTELFGLQTRIFKNGVQIALKITWFNNNNGINTFNVNTTYTTEYGLSTGTIALVAGDTITTDAVYFILGGSGLGAPIKYYNASNVEVTTGTGTVVSKLLKGADNTSMYLLLRDTNSIDGGNIEANMALPTNIKQRDFLKSIMQIFNLYCDFDRDNKNNLIIEPYNDFFTNTVVDWNNRTDLKKDIKTNPSGLLDAKRYVFKYKDDKDFFNTKYKEKWGEVYGSEFIDVDNDFLKNDKINEIIFSASPTVLNETMGANIVKIYKNQETRASEIPNIRLLIAGGIKQSENDWTFKSTGLGDLVGKDYNSALMEDDSITPTVSLQFGFPREFYYDYLATSFTSNVVYQSYHKKQIENITNKNSKVDVRFLWITLNEINKFDFRKKYFIDNGYWMVNKIVNFNPLVEGSVQVELIKLL